MAPRRQIQCLIAAIFYCAGIVNAAPVPARGAQYKPGDQVEIHSNGPGWRTAKVLRVDQESESLRVRLHDRYAPPKTPADRWEDVLTLDVSFHDARPAKPLLNSAQSTRTWKSASGKFSVQAKLMDIREGKIVLARETTGDLIAVPLEKLSVEDAVFVRDQLSSPAILPPRNIGWKEARTVQPAKFSGWSFKPKVAQAAMHTGLTGRKLLLEGPAGADHPFREAQLYVAQDGSRAMVVGEGKHVDDQRQWFVQVADLVSGRLSPPIMAPPGFMIFDAWPDADQVLYRAVEEDTADTSMVTVARLTDAEMFPISSWLVYEEVANQLKGGTKLEGAWFLSADRVMTRRSGDSLTVWDVGAAKALFDIPLGRTGPALTFSGDRQLVALAVKDGISFVDLEEGKHVATMAIDAKLMSNLKENIAFSDDNQRLAGFSQEGVTEWDLNSGKQICEFWQPMMFPSWKLNWAGNMVLLAGRHLFDVERRILLWEYETGDLAAIGTRGGRIWAVEKEGGEKPAALLCAKLPHAAALTQASQLGNASELVLAKRGDSVAIKLQIDQDIAREDEVRSAVAANLMAAGFKIADHADLVVNGVCHRTEPQTIQFKDGGSGATSERTFTPCLSSVSLTYRGEKVWERIGGGQVGGIILKRGQSLDQAIEEKTQPDIRVITKARFPAYVTRPGQGPRGAYGSSELAIGE